MKDNFGDEIKVIPSSHPDGHVYITFTQGDRVMDMALTRDKALKLIAKILDATMGE